MNGRQGQRAGHICTSAQQASPGAPLTDTRLAARLTGSDPRASVCQTPEPTTGSAAISREIRIPPTSSGALSAGRSIGSAVIRPVHRRTQGGTMNVGDLVEALEGLDSDAEVLLAHNQAWPLQFSVRGVAASEDIAADTECEDHGDYNCDECAADVAPVVYLVEGERPSEPYAPRAAWAVAG